MKVSDWMMPEPQCLVPDDTLKMAIELMSAGDFHAVPIISYGKLVGIISDRDIGKHWQKPEATKVGAIMSENPLCISPDDTLNEAIRIILAHKISGLPVMMADRLVGIITTTDILKAVLGLPELN